MTARLFTPAEMVGHQAHHPPLTPDDIRVVARRWYAGWRGQALLNPNDHPLADLRPTSRRLSGLDADGLLWVSACGARSGVWALVKRHLPDGGVAWEHSGLVPWGVLEEAGREVLRPSPLQLDLFSEVDR